MKQEMGLLIYYKISDLIYTMNIKLSYYLLKKNRYTKSN